MDPLLSNWIEDQIGDMHEQSQCPTESLGLNDCVRLIVQNSAELRRDRHTAEKGAEMAWLLHKAIVARCAQTSQCE